MSSWGLDNSSQSYLSGSFEFTFGTYKSIYMYLTERYFVAKIENNQHYQDIY